MNANSPLKTPAIKDWISKSSAQLKIVSIPSARLDAEIILAHTIRKSRTYLHAHDDELLSDRQLEIANARLRLRLDRTPVAYIVGHKEFYGRSFRVTPATLIPRPESEAIIDLLKEIPVLPFHAKLLDVGTGSGCLGITAKLELPELEVTLLDISHYALKVAEANAQQLNATITTLNSDLLSGYSGSADIIIANLPYVDPKWERSPETDYEPKLALFADDNGLELINKLIVQASSHLNKGGALLLEADPRQHSAITDLAQSIGFKHKKTSDYIVYLEKP